MSGEGQAQGQGQGQQGGGDLAARVGTIEAEQQRQGNMLQQILDRLPGAPAAGPGGTVDIGAIQQQVRAEIEAADQRRAAEQAETKWRDDVNTTLERLRRERAPREPETGTRALVQRILIGRPR